MSSGMKSTFKAGLVGLGAAGGALFGIAAKGGAELTETVAKYRAETGAPADPGGSGGRRGPRQAPSGTGRRMGF